MASLVEPRYHTGPEYSRTLGPEVGDLNSLIGYDPDPEQQLGLDAIFGFDEQGRSTAFEVAVICARQNLKTGLFKQAALGWLFITDQKLIVWSAHEFPTAKEAFRDLEEMISGTPWLAKRVKRVTYTAGSEGIELVTGQRLLFKARTNTGGRGLTGDKVVLDEGFALRPEHMGALLPTLSVRPDPQVLYGSSAGSARSDVLRAIRERGRKGSSPRLAYLEWCAAREACADDKCTHEPGTPGCQLDIVDNWKQANPLLGRTRKNKTGLSVEYLQSERQALAGLPTEFARERLGWWDDPGTSEVFGPGKWEAAEREERPDDLQVSGLAVACSIDMRHSALLASGKDDEGCTWLKVLAHGPGTGWLVEEAVLAQQLHGPDVVIDGKGPAAPMVPVLEREGVRLRVATTDDVLDACAGLDVLVRDEMLRYVAAPELDAAVAGAVKRTVRDRWAWGRRESSSDISPLEAGTLAAWSAGELPAVSAYEGQGVMTI